MPMSPHGNVLVGVFGWSIRLLGVVRPSGWTNSKRSLLNARHLFCSPEGRIERAEE